MPFETPQPCRIAVARRDQAVPVRGTWDRCLDEADALLCGSAGPWANGVIKGIVWPRGTRTAWMKGDLGVGRWFRDASGSGGFQVLAVRCFD